MGDAPGILEEAVDIGKIHQWQRSHCVPKASTLEILSRILIDSNYQVQDKQEARAILVDAADTTSKAIAKMDIERFTQQDHEDLKVFSNQLAELMQGMTGEGLVRKINDYSRRASYITRLFEERNAGGKPIADEDVVVLKKKLYKFFEDVGLNRTGISLEINVNNNITSAIFGNTPKILDMRETTSNSRREALSALLESKGGDVEGFQKAFDEYRVMAKVLHQTKSSKSI